MTKNPSNLKAFSFLDRDPQQVADQMARELTREDAAILLQRVDTWVRDVRAMSGIKRCRKEVEHD